MWQMCLLPLQSVLTWHAWLSPCISSSCCIGYDSKTQRAIDSDHEAFFASVWAQILTSAITHIKISGHV